MRRANKKTIKYILTALIAIVGAIGLHSHKIQKTEATTEIVPVPPVFLNEILENDLSDTTSLNGMDRMINRYLSKWCINGASFSVMRNDSLLFAKGYGWADKEKGEKMGPGNILRIASVSKLITATGIMVLQEQGKLNIKDTVFGPSGILCDSVYCAPIKDRNYYKITVEDLMRHKGGFSRRYGDPMFSTRMIMLRNHLDTPPDHETLMKIQLKHRLRFMPGTSQSYSNFGYLVLSLIIEKVSGMPYEDFIQKNVLHPAGCFDMKIAHNYYDEKYPNECKYYVQVNDKPISEYNNSGRMVTRCYGGNDIRALSGAGAWVASTPELARFVASIDGKPEIPDIISQESVNAMTEYFDKETYSLGWNDTKPTGEWTRTGTLSGTTALVKYFPDGECWIMVANTSTWKGPGLARYTSRLFHELRTRYSDELPSRNLFIPNDLASQYYNYQQSIARMQRLKVRQDTAKPTIPMIINRFDSLATYK